MRKRVKNGSPLIAVAYVRVSKDDQKLGPEAQRAQIEVWASREGVTVASWHVDQGVCSITPLDERAGLVAALAALREHGAGIFVVAKRDRIARDPVLTAGVERAAEGAGAVVQSAAGEGNGTSPADEFMRGVIDSAARYERALIRARTKAALAAKRARGESTGTPPFGYRLGEDGRRLVPDEREQATLVTLHELRAAGLSFRQIQREAISRGYFGRTGRPFALRAVYLMTHTVQHPHSR